MQPFIRWVFNQRFTGAWLLPLALGSALLPALIHLSATTALCVLSLFVWYGLQHLGNLSRPQTASLMVAAGLLAGLTWLDYGTLVGRDAGSALAIQMVALKLLEATRQRERVFLYLAGYCLLFCSFLFSQSLLTAVLFVPALLLLTAGLLESSTHGLTGWRNMRYAGILLVQAMPFMLAGFLLFPRAEIARWNLPYDAVKAMTGFSGTLSPGSVSQLAKSDAVAFRVQFQGDAPPQSALYWRGRVLTLFDGATWHGDDMPEELMRQDLLPVGATSRYTVTLEPHNQVWLFALDVPMASPAAGLLSSEHTLQALRPVQAVMTYEAVSARDHLPLRQLGPAGFRRNLQLPSDENPRSLALAQQWRVLQDPARIVEEALALFRNDFRYSLNPPATKAFDQVDAFLFNNRVGFCEHYAGSFVFLMRAAGVPARVVTGYQGGEVDASSGLVTVRQAHAHAWAEVWMAERGWVRVDPVTVLPGSQVDRGTPAPPAPSQAAATSNAETPGPQQASASDRAAMAVEHQGALQRVFGRMQHGWNRHVLSYRERTQLRLLQRVTGTKPDPMVLLAWCAGALLAVAVLLRWWLGRSSSDWQDPLLRAWMAFQRKCARAGCEADPAEGPYDFSERCIRQFPSQTGEIRAIRDAYITQRYASLQSEASKRDLLLMVKRFRVNSDVPARS